MSTAMPRRSFLTILLALVCGPWLARREKAEAAVPKPQPPAKGSPRDQQELVSRATTCVYDGRPQPWKLWDGNGSLLTTYTYDGSGRVVSTQDKDASS